MSYTQSVSREVPYSGSVAYSGTVSYPASEHGGSTSYSGRTEYSGTVPVTVNVTVETSAFDGSINRVNSSLDGLTGSVVAMNSAQCMSIANAANKVAESVTKGFFGMIRSEISQNLSLLYNQIQSSMGLITDRYEHIIQTQKNMDADYKRTRERYTKIFQDLNDELYRRIHRLDEKAFLLSEKIHREQLGKVQTDFVADTVEKSLDSGGVDKMLHIGHTKDSTRETLKGIHGYISQELVYSRKINSILKEVHIDEEDQLCVPVVYMETSSLDSDGTKQNCHATEKLGKAREKILDGTMNYFSAGDVSWKNPDEETERKVDSEFNTLAEKVEDSRVYEMIMRLKNAAGTLTN